MNEQSRTHLEILACVKRNDRTTWTRIGTAFPTKDGRGYRLKLEYTLVHGDTEIVMLPPTAKESTEEGQ
jgi:hypothetical protein